MSKKKASLAKNAWSATKKGGPSTVTSACGLHALLKATAVTFDNCLAVDNDTYGDFVGPHWKEGRAADAATHWPAQFPVAYVRRQKLELTIKFEVIRKPNCTEKVWVKGVARLSHGKDMVWAKQVTVRPSDDSVTVSALTSDIALPDYITYFDPFLIQWTSNWASDPHLRSVAGTSSSPLYVLLGRPQTSPLFWTVVHYSCVHAHSKNTEKEAIPAMYGAFVPKMIRRKRDSIVLRYWDPLKDEVYTCQDLLGNPSGCGRCGAWSHFFLDMCRVHGNASAYSVTIHRGKLNAPSYIGMLVKNWSFKRSMATSRTAGPYTFTHEFGGGDQSKVLSGVPGGGCEPENGAAAQGNGNPQSLFYDHAILTYDGAYYDPSYGSPRAMSGLEWEVQGLDGIFIKTSAVQFGAKHPGTQVFNFTGVVATVPKYVPKIP